MSQESITRIQRLVGEGLPIVSVCVFDPSSLATFNTVSSDMVIYCILPSRHQWDGWNWR